MSMASHKAHINDVTKCDVCPGPIIEGVSKEIQCPVNGRGRIWFSNRRGAQGERVAKMEQSRRWSVFGLHLAGAIMRLICNKNHQINYI